ncbi:MAG: hypothetical protein IKT40_12670 [Bacilli bacterium]|nr:hypothetical protein [Bacilli bacterium]
MTPRTKVEIIFYKKDKKHLEEKNSILKVMKKIREITQATVKVNPAVIDNKVMYQVKVSVNDYRQVLETIIADGWEI